VALKSTELDRVSEEGTTLLSLFLCFTFSQRAAQGSQGIHPKLEKTSKLANPTLLVF
jgi:hypothetical protein